MCLKTVLSRLPGTAARQVIGKLCFSAVKQFSSCHQHLAMILESFYPLVQSRALPFVKHVIRNSAACGADYKRIRPQKNAFTKKPNQKIAEKSVLTCNQMVLAQALPLYATQDFQARHSSHEIKTRLIQAKKRQESGITKRSAMIVSCNPAHADKKIYLNALTPRPSHEKPQYDNWPECLSDFPIAAIKQESRGLTSRSLFPLAHQRFHLGQID